MAIDINTVIENLNELLTNSVNLTDKYYDLFINPEPMMIDLELYNEDNQLVVVTVPNRAMDRENFGQLIEKVDALAEVASTGEYTDLKNVPDGTLTIQGNGSTVATFNNSSNTDVTANIQYPTRTSQLVNDAGFITNVTIPAHALKGYLDEGELLTDLEGLTDVKYYAHSTFDSTKFTVVGSPTITDEGIVSGFQYGNYLQFFSNSIGVNYSTFEISYKINSGTLLPSSIYYLGSTSQLGLIIGFHDSRSVVLASSDGENWDIQSGPIGSYTYSNNTDYWFKLKYDGTKYVFQYSLNGMDYTDDKVINVSTKLPMPVLFNISNVYGSNNFTGSIDLKTVMVKIDGAITFRGNQVGVDTYTIANVDVEIPYTLSKTGSKIVDSTYRSRVNLVYNAFGYSPYYTLSDTNYTIPQGELYGYIKKEIQNTVPEVDIPSSRNVGEIVVSTIPLVDAGLHLLDGSLINGNGIYSEFVDYISSIYDASANYFCSESEWQDSVETYGVCGKFVYDSVNNTVRLPKITGFVEGASGVANLGDLTQAGLPNITGNFGANFAQGNFFNKGSGAFGSYRDNSINTTVPNDSANQYSNNNMWDFDASRSSSIYDNSNTVQPQSVKVLYYIVIATSTKTQIQVDIDEVATDLNNKVDKSSLNEIYPVVETYSNGISWYRVYSDGWCEQGGEVTATSDSANQTISLLKNYVNTNYDVSVTPTISTATAATQMVVITRTTSSFTTVNTSSKIWVARGYIS